MKINLRNILKLDKKITFSILISLITFFILFIFSCFFLNDSNVKLFPSIIYATIIFELFDSIAGMGYGTAITPFLLMLGFDPIQFVPSIMVQQTAAGLISAFLHKEFGNVHWSFKRPFSEATKLYLLIITFGSIFISFSIILTYSILKIPKLYIKLYSSLLLIFMGIFSLIKFNKKKKYNLKNMIFWSSLAGFNKGIGGGGYGPVITIGGLLSGIPIKNMIATTAFSEGTVCLFSLIIWFYMSTQISIDFLLLPSVIIGSIASVLVSPYLTKVISEKFWNFLVPIYCCLLSIYSLHKVLSSL